ncbi:hypothetical protein [Propioniferax innocua]|uniref:hypothetical protein n=1 Tax=Propioniferax innocua TaxID=1753 RepID=UPI0031D6496A
MLTRRPLWHHAVAAPVALAMFWTIMLIGFSNPGDWMALFECIGYTPEYCEVLKQTGSNGQEHMVALVLLFGVMVVGAVLAWWGVLRCLAWRRRDGSSSENERMHPSDGNEDRLGERHDAEHPERNGEHPVKPPDSRESVKNSSDYALFLLGIGLIVAGGLMTQFPLPFHFSLPPLRMSGNFAGIMLLVGAALLVITPLRARMRREDQ